MDNISTRANILTRRTYNRPLNKDGTTFETWEQTIARVIGHQQWLWERQLNSPLSEIQLQELDELEVLMLERKASCSGRTLWLGGTDISRSREASQFNCAFTEVETIYDTVDVLWLLLQGCGVGIKPVVGTLTGFRKQIRTLEIIRSKRTSKGGLEYNVETWDSKTKVWTIKIGDSAEAWAKSIGKLVAGKYPAKKLVLDFSELRPAGLRLSGYGWISSGDFSISKAYSAIFDILNSRADMLLTKINIMDIVNWLGTILSSRRSAEIVLFTYGNPEWKEFAIAKKDWFLHNKEHRTQSNNSLVFYKKPSKEELQHIFKLMEEAGGSEPGFINAEAALNKAPWFKGVNPCVEVLLGNKSFCNLFEIDVGKYIGDNAALHRAVYIVARANYRQTCVNLNDGILQEAWHLNNEFLRLCGVGLTGIAKRPDLVGYDYKYLRRMAVYGAYSMAEELGTPRPKNVTLIKPSGTLSKIMDTTEGAHRPLGKYIFNNVQFGKHDPLVEILQKANYKVFNHPTDDTGILVTLPVSYDDVEFETINEVEVNLETAIEQLTRYKLLQDNWSDQNVSVTISYDKHEVPDIINWLLANWESYVGVSFIYRNDPTKTASDLGYLFLPQEVVTKKIYEDYVSKLLPVNLDSGNSFDELINDECISGICPVK
jgi:ribonucleoside-triphosphate reductase